MLYAYVYECDYFQQENITFIAVGVVVPIVFP